MFQLQHDQKLHFAVIILSKQSAANVSKNPVTRSQKVNSNCEQRNN